MGFYILRRVLMLIPILLGVTFLTFAVIQITPGDPAALMLGQYATPEDVANLRRQMGLDDPVIVQYLRYVTNVVRGDLGVSFRGQTPVLTEILDRFPKTLELTVTATLMSATLGISLGTIAATSKHKFWDRLTMIVAMIGLSIPNFFLGIILIIVLGVQLQWISVTGGDGLLDLLVPALVLALNPAATLARLTRSSILEVKGMDYVRTARAKGLSPRAVTARHVLRNALIPVVTAIGLSFGALLGGAVFIEAVFARPGLGRFAINAIMNRDYPQVQGMVLFLATVYVLVNLSVDLVYGLLDPQIRYH
ncbi:MAG: ABC transporter permease [Anaerolinea sp.]|nr:ABC transporter permease [Anaerolinea sp.]